MFIIHFTLGLLKKLLDPANLLLLLLFLALYLPRYAASFFVRDREKYLQDFLKWWVKFNLDRNNVVLSSSWAGGAPYEKNAVILCDYNLICGISAYLVLKGKVSVVAEPEFFMFPLSLVTKASGWLRLSKERFAAMKGDYDKMIRAAGKGVTIIMVNDFNERLDAKSDAEIDETGAEYLSIKTGLPVVPVAAKYPPGFKFSFVLFKKKTPAPVELVFGVPLFPGQRTVDPSDRRGFYKEINEGIKSIKA